MQEQIFVSHNSYPDATTASQKQGTKDRHKQHFGDQMAVHLLLRDHTLFTPNLGVEDSCHLCQGIRNRLFIHFTLVISSGFI